MIKFNMIGSMIKIVLAFLVISSCMSFVGVAFAQDDFPNKPITIYCGYPVGGSTGVIATVLANALEKELGVPVTLVEKGGATTTLALGTIAKLPADGYSLAVASYSGTISAPYTYKLPYDSKKDIDTIYAITAYNAGFAVPSESPYKTFRQFLDWAKANPGKAKWASSGATTFGHLVMEYIGHLEGIEWKPIGAKGGAAAIKLALGGQVDGSISGTQISFIRNGQMRLLADFAPPEIPPAYSGYVKKEDMNNVITLDALGYPDLMFVNPVIMVAPSGLPADIRQKLVDAIQKATYDEKFKDVVAKFDEPAFHNGGDEFINKTSKPLDLMLENILKKLDRLKKG